MSRSTATAIAARYATAIFSLAQATKKPEQIVQEIGTIAAAMESDDALRGALANPLLARASKGSILADLASGAHKTTLQSLHTLAAQGRADLLPTIATQLRARLAEARGELVADVESARPLSTSMQQQLVDRLSHATGKTVQLNLKENPALLGGVAIQIGSKRLDASLAAALSTMRRDLLAINA